MRIISGQFKGRRLTGPQGDGLRPTSDSLRETLFNVLGQTLPGRRVLDGFAGTGAIGLEALSRGAAHVTFVEQNRRALEVLTKNVLACGVQEACAIIRDDFGRGRWGAFDLVVIDPPYDIPDLEAVAHVAAVCVAPGGRLVLEHGRRRASPASLGTLARTRLLEAGDSALSFYNQ